MLKEWISGIWAGQTPGRLVGVMLLTTVVSLAVIAGIYFLNPGIQDDVLKTVCSTLMQLVVLGIVGVYVKYLFDRRQEERKREEDKREESRRETEIALEREREDRKLMTTIRFRIIEKLSDAYNSILSARVFISANLSLESYDECIANLLGVQGRLVNLADDAITTIGAFRNPKIIAEQIGIANKYLDEIVQEYTDRRQSLVDLQDKKSVRGKLYDFYAIKGFFCVENKYIVQCAQPLDRALKMMYKEYWSGVVWRESESERGNVADVDPEVAVQE